eukprot:401450-Hanusia_phi.AAC.1
MQQEEQSRSRSRSEIDLACLQEGSQILSSEGAESETTNPVSVERWAIKAGWDASPVGQPFTIPVRGGDRGSGERRVRRRWKWREEEDTEVVEV